MVQGLERFFKTAIVDRNTSISSAALVSSYHLFPIARDTIRRWANEAQEAVNSKSSSSGGSMGFGGQNSFLSGYSGSQNQPGYQVVPSSSYITQYHALGLLYLIRQSDRMAITKLIQQLGTGGRGSGGSPVLRSPYALCMLIRFAAKVLDEDPK